MAALFAAEKLNRPGPAVINKQLVSLRGVESQPIPDCNTYLSAYALEGEMSPKATEGVTAHEAPTS